MGTSPLSAGISPLDKAHELHLTGRVDEAVRICIALLAADPDQIGAVSLLTAILLEQNRSLIAGEAAPRLVDAWIRRGDLPAATFAAKLTDLANGDTADGDALRKRIAEAFGKGSARVTDVAALAPPPLPADLKITPALKNLGGEPLFDTAEETLRRFLREDDSKPANAGLPRLPLFGDLEPAALERLLSVFELRTAPTGHAVLKQGEEGREAFVVVRGVLEVARRAGDAELVTIAGLGPGSIFGEMALVSEAPRAASVTAVEPVELLVATRAALESLAEDEPTVGRELGAFCRQRMLSNLVRHSAILAAIDPAQRGDLVRRFQTRSFEQDDVLVQRGAEAEGLFLIASGGVAVFGEDEDGDPIRIAELGPGDVVGEISLVLRRPAMADVVALHPTVALELTREEFQQTIREHPSLLGELYELATKREEETRSVVAQQALDITDSVLV